jgi:hypothetical protein
MECPVEMAAPPDARESHFRFPTCGTPTERPSLMAHISLKHLIVLRSASPGDRTIVSCVSNETSRPYFCSVLVSGGRGQRFDGCMSLNLAYAPTESQPTVRHIAPHHHARLIVRTPAYYVSDNDAYRCNHYSLIISCVPCKQVLFHSVARIVRSSDVVLS